MRFFAPHPLRRSIAAATLLALVAGSAGATASGPARREVATGPSHEVVVSGRVRGLYPGATKLMKVVVRNLLADDVRLIELRGTPTSPRPDCPSSALRVRPLRATPIVPGRGMVRVPMRVALRRMAPDACQGIRFLVTFRAKAVPA